MFDDVRLARDMRLSIIMDPALYRYPNDFSCPICKRNSIAP